MNKKEIEIKIPVKSDRKIVLEDGTEGSTFDYEIRATRIKSAINASKLTYDDVENETNISVSTLKRITSGEREPKISEILKIARAVGANPIDLTFGKIDEQIATQGNLLNAKRSGYITKEEQEKLSLIVMIKDLDNEKVSFLIKQIELLNLQDAINKISNK